MILVGVIRAVVDVLLVVVAVVAMYLQQMVIHRMSVAVMVMKLRLVVAMNLRLVIVMNLRLVIVMHLRVVVMIMNLCLAVMIINL